LNAYLNEQHTPVQTLTLTAPEDRSNASGMDQGGGQGMQQGAGQNSGQSGYSEPQSTTQFNPSAISASSFPEASARTAGTDSATPAMRPEGSHISVMA
jgi:hypothetical protein